MSTKRLSETISDLVQSNPKRACKTLELVKNRLIEWPETVDQYSSLLTALINCGMMNKNNIGQVLCVIEIVLGDFLKSLSATFAEVSPHVSVLEKIVSFSCKLLDEKQFLVSQDGAVEYMCRLVKTVCSGSISFRLNVASLSIGLLELPTTRSRQEELIKAAVLSVLSEFRSDLTLTEVSEMLKETVKLFERSEKINDALFALNYAVWIVERAPLLARDFTDANPLIIWKIFSYIASLVPKGYESRNSQPLVTLVIESLRWFTLLAVSSSFFHVEDPQVITNLMEFLGEQRERETRFSDSFFKIIDLSVDLILLQTGGFKVAFESAKSLDDEFIATRIVERWSSVEDILDFFVIEKCIQESIEKGFFLLTSALIEKLASNDKDSRSSSVESCLFVSLDQELENRSFSLSKGGEALLSRFEEKIQSKIMERNPSVPTLRCVLSLSTVYARKDVNRLKIFANEIPNWIAKIEKFDENSCFLASRVLVIFRSVFSSVENSVFDFAQSLEPKVLFWLIMRLVGCEWALSSFSVQYCRIELIRESFSFRKIKLLPSPPIRKLPEKPQIRKALSFLTRLVRRAIDSQAEEVRSCLSNLLSVFVIVGSLDKDVKCDSCLLTEGLTEACKGPSSRATHLLKLALREASELFLGIPVSLCQCSLHKDSLGEPRSLLSQAPISVSQYVSESSSRFSPEEVIVGHEILLRKKFQILDMLSEKEIVDMAEQLEQLDDHQSIDKTGILIHISKKLQNSFSLNKARFALIISRSFSQLNTNNNIHESLLEFLAENILCPSGGFLTALLTSREVMAILLKYFSFQDLVSDVEKIDEKSLPGTALRLAIILHNEATTEQCARGCHLLEPILVHGVHALYVIDELRKALPTAAVRNIFASAIVPEAPADLISLIAEELDIVDVVSALTSGENGIGSVAMGLLTNLTTLNVFSTSPYSPLQVLLLALELQDILHLSGKTALQDPIVTIQSIVRLSDRPWFMVYIAAKHPWTADYISGLFDAESLPLKFKNILAIDPSENNDAKKLCLDKTENSEWPISAILEYPFKISKRDEIFFPILKSLIFVSVFAVICDSFEFESFHVPLLYEMQSCLTVDVSFSKILEITRFVMEKKIQLKGLVPDSPLLSNQKIVFPSHESLKKKYPISPLCRLVVELLPESWPLTLRNVCATNERITREILPYLLLLLREGPESSEIINGAIESCACEISRAILVGKQIEFKLTSLWVPESLGILRKMDFNRFCETLLRKGDAFGAYFFSTLLFESVGGKTFENPIDQLFSESSGTLPIVLASLQEIGVEIDSFSLSLHPSLRGSISRLRKDYVSLLFESDSALVQCGLSSLGVNTTSRIEDRKLTEMSEKSIRILLQSKKIDEISFEIFSNFFNLSKEIFLQKFKFPNSVSSCDALFEIYKEKSFFPPKLHNERNESIFQLVEFLRKSRKLLHKARVIAEYAITETISPTTCPAIRLKFFYSLSKILWQLCLFPEATHLIATLTVSEEISRVDVPAVLEMGPRIYSRAALWVGERRVESLDEIRTKYFAKAIKGADLKNEIKAKMRFVKVLDPVVTASSGSLLIEEFSLLCEILSCGIIVREKSTWFASRLISLWFSNPGPTTPYIAQHRKSLAASTALLPFFYQVIGRIGQSVEESEFKKELILFIIESAKIHTSICLPPILQIASSSTGTNKTNGKSAQALRLEAERSKQADLIINKIKATTGGSVDSLRAAFRFYLNLAMTQIVVGETEKFGTSSRPKSGSSKHRLVSEIDGFKEYSQFFSSTECPVLTSDRGIAVKSIKPEFSVAETGRSLPKILTLVDIEGKLHKQIVKGNDDLRNDTVLQQLFSMLDSVTALNMRSYKVVPITASAGIAEWVVNTVTIGSYLVGYPSEETGAHMRYHPNELTPSSIKSKMVQIRQQNLKNQNQQLLPNLLSGYKSMCENFSPSMKYFFYEHFSSSPKNWFNAQEKFANSVAATSIVGFIVGLGDRHPNNILIDFKTGEVVHIDYGICFEAGTQLKIPEIVPFRLTRDMVDGLGCLGTQGPFYKKCQDVLLSLKNNSSLVTAVVEVFVADPLFNWAVASLVGSDNAQAALQGVKRKLQGFLDSRDVIPLTPAAQVDRLIRMATDPRYLCQMFAGWQPWL